LKTSKKFDTPKEAPGMKKMDEMELHIERTAARWAYRYSFVFLSLWCLGGLLQGWKSGLSAGDAFSKIRIPFLLLITREAVHDGAVLICRAKAVLMEVNLMSEAEAHRFLQKYSMDTGLRLAETARLILERYTTG